MAEQHAFHPPACPAAPASPSARQVQRRPAPDVHAGSPARALGARIAVLAACAWLAVAPAGARAEAGGQPGTGGAQAAASAAASNAAPVSLERRVKAAFLYKFLGYTEFPATAFADPASPVVIGLAGADELAAELSRIVAGRTVQSRAIAVKIVKEGEAPAGVHLLFVGGNDSARLRSVLKAAQPAPVLTVTEADNGLQQGSVINFKVVEERVRFDVSLEAADRNSVKLSSRLLTVANHVHKGAP